MSRSLDDQLAEMYSGADTTPGQVGEGEIDPKLRRSLEVLHDALGYIQSTEKTRDYFSGYTFVEALEDRIAEIGEDVEDASTKNGALALRVNPDDRTAKVRASVRVRNLTGFSKLEELAILKDSVLRAVDHLLAETKADEARKN
jgi:hypothetical protein